MDLSLFEHIELARPGWLWVLLPLALAWLAAATVLRQRMVAASDVPGYGASAQRRYRYPGFGLLLDALRQQPNMLPHVRSGWRMLVLACLLLALAQPEHVGPQLPQPAQRRDLVFIVDNSVAMNLRDYVFDQQRVARLTVLKGVLSRFVDQLRGDRISIVLYADEPYTLVPLTYDHGLVHNALERIGTGLAGRSNAVGDAVALAVKEAGETEARRRVLVLFSSAARPTGTIEPLDAARLAAQRQLRLYTVAIGAGSAAAEERRSSGLIYDPADLARLQTMAEITGAEAYVTTDTRELNAAIATIGRLETDPVAVEPRYVRRPLYQWPLLAGGLLLSVAQLGALLRRRQWS